MLYREVFPRCISCLKRGEGSAYYQAAPQGGEERESLLNLRGHNVNLMRPERAQNQGSTGPKRQSEERRGNLCPCISCLTVFCAVNACVAPQFPFASVALHSLHFRLMIYKTFRFTIKSCLRLSDYLEAAAPGGGERHGHLLGGCVERP